jgi:uncharacterized protein
MPSKFTTFELIVKGRGSPVKPPEGTMKVALIGATGNVGSRILAELSNRNHRVTAIVRHPEKVPSLPNVEAKRGDLFDESALSTLLAGHDAVVSSVRFASSDPRKLIEAVRASGVTRYIVVGGAASLEVAPGVKLIDSPSFPNEYKPEAAAGIAFRELLNEDCGVNWTFICPSAMFVPGQRTGQFRLGKDQLLSNAQGSCISFEDFAVALVDELETGAHPRQRFTVGY